MARRAALSDIWDEGLAYDVECRTTMGGVRRYRYWFRVAPAASLAGRAPNVPLPARQPERQGDVFHCWVTIELVGVGNKITVQRRRQGPLSMSGASSGGTSSALPSLAAASSSPTSASAQPKPPRSTTNEFTAVVFRPHRTYVLVCERLGTGGESSSTGHKIQMVAPQERLSPPLALVLQYHPRGRQWRVEGSFNDIRALFTLNCYQESHGPLASLLSTSGQVLWTIGGSAGGRPSMAIVAKTVLGVEMNRFTPCEVDDWDEDDDDATSTTRPDDDLEPSLESRAGDAPTHPLMDLPRSRPPREHKTIASLMGDAGLAQPSPWTN